MADESTVPGARPGDDGGDVAESVSEAVAEVGDHPIVENGARLGYAVNGLVHLLIAWIALQLAFGKAAGSSADQSGALATLAGTPFGTISLWLGVAGFGLLALWHVTEAVIGHDTFDRVKAAGKAILYAVLGWSCLGVLRGKRSSSGEQSADFTADLLTKPAGRILVVAVGLGVLGIAGYHVVKGWQKRFLRDLREHPGTWAVYAGRYGYVAKGIALAVVGGMFVLAGVRESAADNTGLDGALHNLLGFPFGQALLALVALGFAA